MNTKIEYYMNDDHDAFLNGTTSAREALQWIRSGHDVLVRKPGKKTRIKGEPPAQERTRDHENRDRCRRIAHYVEAYASGAVYRCPDCGDENTLPDSVGDKWHCPRCHAVNDVDDLEPLGLYDYFEDVLDIQYSVASDRETVLGARFLVACGGPNIWIDSMTRQVELYWWTESANYPLSWDACEALDEFARELWEV